MKTEKIYEIIARHMSEIEEELTVAGLKEWYSNISIAHNDVSYTVSRHDISDCEDDEED